MVVAILTTTEFTLNGEIGGLVAGENTTQPQFLLLFPPFPLFFSFLTAFQQHGNLGFKVDKIVLIPLADVDFWRRDWIRLRVLVVDEGLQGSEIFVL